MSVGLMRALPLGRRRIQARSLNLPAVFGGVLLLATILSLLYLTQASTVSTRGYDIKSLEEERAQLLVRNEQLRLAVEQLQSLDRVEKEAASRLRMGPPEKLIFLNVEIPAFADSSAAPPIRRRSFRSEESSWWDELQKLFGQ